MNSLVTPLQSAPISWEVWAAMATVGSLALAVLSVMIGQISLVVAKRRRARERAEYVQDLHTLISAHIKKVITRYGSLEDQIERFEELKQKLEADPEFVPFFFNEPKNRIFQPETHNLMSLPTVTLEGIFDFYDLLAEHDTMVADFRTQQFSSLSPDRRRAILVDFAESYRRLHASGEGALFAIKDYHTS